MPETLGERQAAILRAVVREFIRTGEPVGSKHLLDRMRLEVSAATVRNEMARLEELGYLTHPHTSAGRTPTDIGYRFVVDSIKRPRALAEGQQRQLAEELGDDAGSIDDLLRRAGDVVSRFTHHAAALLAWQARSSRLRRIELIRVGAGRANVIAIAENGRVEHGLIAVEPSLTEDQVRDLGERLSRTHSGARLEDVVENLRADDAPAAEREAMAGVASACQDLLDAEPHIVIGGAANLAGKNDFERESLHRLYEALEQQTAVLELLANSLEARFTVRIGSELEDEVMRECSVVVAPFGPSADARGTVGVIGPMRMDYERVIATANAVARLIETTLGPPES